jgi:hypothetical protein
MRIYGGAGAVGAGPAARPRPAGTSTFSIPQEESGTSPASVNATRMAGGIDALLALQGVDDPTERRRRSVARGRHALDVLEELKLAVLAGTLDATALNRLSAAAVDLKEPSGDRNLDGVLAEIELRVEVELAKMGSKPAV